MNIALLRQEVVANQIAPVDVRVCIAEYVAALIDVESCVDVALPIWLVIHDMIAVLLFIEDYFYDENSLSASLNLPEERRRIVLCRGEERWLLPDDGLSQMSTTSHKWYIWSPSFFRKRHRWGHFNGFEKVFMSTNQQESQTAMLGGVSMNNATRLLSSQPLQLHKLCLKI